MTVTRTVGTEKHQSKLCAQCVRAQGGWLFELALGSGMIANFPTSDADVGAETEDEGDLDLDEAIAGVPFDALMDACFAGDEAFGDDWEDDLDELENHDLAPEDDELELNLFQTLEAVEGEVGAVCPGCGATWQRIGHEERVGCARCYPTFRGSLARLLEQIQRAPHHEGKSPRAAGKRRLRLEHLRQRRDHQLQMLQGRLAGAVAAERYEEAAVLRDKIKLLSSSLF